MDDDIAPEDAFPGRPTLASVRRKSRRILQNASKGKAGLLCVFAVLCAGLWAYTVDWPGVVTALAVGRPSYPADPALLEQARALGLDYETVAARPSAHDGKPVLWCLGRDGARRVVVSGNTGWHVSIDAPALPEPEGHHTAVCRKTLAVVETGKVAGVNLRFAGFP